MHAAEARTEFVETDISGTHALNKGKTVSGLHIRQPLLFQFKPLT